MDNKLKMEPINGLWSEGKFNHICDIKCESIQDMLGSDEFDWEIWGLIGINEGIQGRIKEKIEKYRKC